MVNSVVKGDFRAFEVPLSYIGHLCNPCKSKAAKSKLKSFFLSTYSHSLHDKKRIRRVPLCSREKKFEKLILVDLVNTLGKVYLHT